MTILVSLLTTIAIYIWIKLTHSDIAVAEIILLIGCYNSVAIPFTCIPLRMNVHGAEALKRSKIYNDIFTPIAFRDTIMRLVCMAAGYCVLLSFLQEGGFTIYSGSTLLLGSIIIVSTLGSLLLNKEGDRLSFLYTTTGILYLFVLIGLYWIPEKDEYVEEWLYLITSGVAIASIAFVGMLATVTLIEREIK